MTCFSTCVVGRDNRVLGSWVMVSTRVGKGCMLLARRRMRHGDYVEAWGVDRCQALEEEV